jgi:transposase
MGMLAEQYYFVIGGGPDRDTIDLAILDTSTGRVHAQISDRADGPAYRRLLSWADRHAPG